MLQINSVRHDWPNPPGFCLNRQNGRSDYTFVHFSTSVDLQIGGETIAVPEHSCIVYNPETPQHFSCPNGMLHDWFHFINVPLDFFEILGIPTDILFRPNQWIFITAIVEEIENEFYRARQYSEELIDIKIKELFIKLSQALKNQPQISIGEETVFRFRNLRKEVMQSLSHNWTVSEMASRLYLSPSRFSHIYKSIYATTPVDDLIHARIDNAKNALLFTDKTIEDIASDLGYNHASHFCRQFSQYTGIAPSKYKKSFFRNAL